MKLSIIIPCYNEKNTIRTVLDKIKQADLNAEVIIVDDGSTDGTREILQQIPINQDLQIIYHEKNMGKGAAIITALQHTHGDYAIIQDADLEYDPQDISRLIDLANEQKAAVVYGSRNLAPTNRGKFFFFWGGVLLTHIANIIYSQNLTDVATGYKLFQTDLLRKINLREKGFGFCYEVTAKVAKLGYHIVEVPVSYNPRTVTEGKKITLKDGAEAAWLLIKYRFFA